jgi:hypothetical protein
MHDPEMRDPASWQGHEAISQANFNTDNHTEAAPNLQAFRLVSKFGFAFETAVVISQLAWGLAR